MMSSTSIAGLVRRLSLVLSAGLAVLPLRAQTLVYATTGVQLESYNVTTHAAQYSLASGLSFPGQMAIGAGGQVYIALAGQQQVAVYDPVTHQLNGSFLPQSLNSIAGVAVWNNVLYVAQGGGIQRISTYDATSGALLNANFILNVYNPSSVVIDAQGRLYVPNNNAQVSVYSATTGALLNAALVTVNNPISLAVDAAGTLFISNAANFGIGAYSATTGAVINASLVTGLSAVPQLAVDNLGHLYASVYNANGGYYAVDQFNAATGALQATDLVISGGAYGGLAVYAVPEPATWLLLAGGLGLAVLAGRPRRRMRA